MKAVFSIPAPADAAPGTPGTSVDLGDDALRAFITQVSDLSGQGLVQTMAYSRAASVSKSTRGNIECRLAITVERSFDTKALALLHILDEIRLRTLNKGTLTLVETLAGGSSSRTLTEAVIARVSHGNPAGETTRVTYHIEGATWQPGAAAP